MSCSRCHVMPCKWPLHMQHGSCNLCLCYVFTCRKGNEADKCLSGKQHWTNWRIKKGESSHLIRIPKLEINDISYPLANLTQSWPILTIIDLIEFIYVGLGMRLSHDLIWNETGWGINWNIWKPKGQNSYMNSICNLDIHISLNPKMEVQWLVGSWFSWWSPFCPGMVKFILSLGEIQVLN
jgi:hypothetical protein